MSEAAQQRKARKKAHKKFMKIMAGPQFTKLAHSVGIPASVHGVKFSVIMTRVALALDPSCTNVDETLRKALGKTEEAFEKRWPRSRHVLVERKPNATVKPESACRRLGSPHKDYVKTMASTSPANGENFATWHCRNMARRANAAAQVRAMVREST